MVLRGEQKFQAALTPQKEPLYPLEEADWAPRLVWTAFGEKEVYFLNREPNSEQSTL
jgi:hypothetical protein